MRIISGIRRGKRLITLEGQNTRPTLERVKQSIFDTLQFKIQGRVVLDLFAGSGQMGLEALSRGAEFCYFNDMDKRACKVIDQNIKACRFEKMSKLTCQSYEQCVKILEIQAVKPSLVFIDPPYAYETADCESLLASMIASGVASVSADTLIVLERSARSVLPTMPEGWELIDTRNYGETSVLFIQSKRD